ncbi:hypothetical protein [Salmonirosea aquatica]|uniref:Uncharacterized protein n=1 Tax=Salmonirosea aquatica TaxID=2654236 RepID=A0A7C9BLY6_9BACT|nr:hypothetical protein [Cytophagaceae bacterium SJW1-29]
MNTITYRGKTYKGPASWHECTPEHWGALVGFARLPKADRTDDVVRLAAQLWLQVPSKAWSRWTLDAPQWEALQAQFAWIWEPPTGRPCESFGHEGETYYVFDEDFADTKALDLTMALMEYLAFAHPDAPDPTAYERILATLCRPARADLARFRRSDDWDGDVREPYNELRAADRADQFISLSEPVKLALFDYFERSAHDFLLNYERLFGGGGGEEPRYPDGRGWLMLLKNVAKDGHFGDFDRVGRQPAHLVYAALLDDVLTHEEITNPSDHE